MKVIKDFLKTGSINRPGSVNSCRYITVHETGNTKKGADAKSHAEYIKNIKTKTSWQYTVDEKAVYQHIPDKEKSYHTSDGFANENSISVELCVNSDGNFTKTKENAAELIRELCEKYGIAKENIKSHYDWTGKNCPQKIIKEGWEDFLKLCESKTEAQKVVSIEQLKEMGFTHISL